MKNAKSELGTWTLAAAAYNRGLYGVKRDLSNQKVDTYYELFMNTETSRYVFRLIAYKLIMENPSDYGFSLKKSEYYTNTPTVNISVDTTISDLAEFALQNGTNYKTVRLLNPWIRDDHLIVKQGEKLVIEVPK